MFLGSSLAINMSIRKKKIYSSIEKVNKEKGIILFDVSVSVNYFIFMFYIYFFSDGTQG